MFENLLNLVKEHAGDAIVNNPAIPNEHNDAAISTATEGIVDHLKNLTANGGLEKLTSMFSGGNVANNPEVAALSSNVAGSLMNKFGISNDQASLVVKSLIPVVMGKLVSKTNDPNDKSFDLNGIIGALAGGNTGNIGGLIGGLKNLF
jgi:Bacterial protein of unknown function (DUF937)